MFSYLNKKYLKQTINQLSLKDKGLPKHIQSLDIYSQSDNYSIITLFNSYQKHYFNLSFICSLASVFTGCPKAFVWCLLTACQINHNPFFQFVTKAKLYSQVQLQWSSELKFCTMYLFVQIVNIVEDFIKLLLPMLLNGFYF